MKELKKKYIKPYACVHECAYGEGLMNDATAGGTHGNPDETTKKDDGNPDFGARPSGNPTFFESGDENEYF